MQDTIAEINKSILLLEGKLRSDFPELVKYIPEMPVKLSYEADTDIKIKNLEDYYNSLKELMQHYALSHEKLDTFQRTRPKR